MVGELHGRLVRDCELKTGTKDGREWSICNFTIAVDNRYPREDASFIDCYCSGKRGEAIAKFLHKGSEIVVRGDLRQEPYTDKDGNTKRPFKFVVDDFDFCGKGGNGAEPKKNEPAPEGFETLTEEIPF